MSKTALLIFVLLAGRLGASAFVEVTDIEGTKGNIRVLLFSDEDGFPGDSAKAAAKFHREAKDAVKGTIRIELKDLKDGVYAVVVLQDIDNNGVLKKGMFGIPAEPVGVTNWSSMSRPKFRASRVAIRDGQIVRVKLR